jgi:hypothetical protein
VLPSETPSASSATATMMIAAAPTAGEIAAARTGSSSPIRAHPIPTTDSNASVAIDAQTTSQADAGTSGSTGALAGLTMPLGAINLAPGPSSADGVNASVP